MDDRKPPTSNLPTPTDDIDRKLLADIKEYGWHVIAVPEDEEGPAFAYSIGLFHSLQHAEVIVFGLDVRLMHEMINRIGEQFLCGTTNRTEDIKIVSLGAMFQRDPNIGELADLPEGWRAERQDVQLSWIRSKNDEQ